MPQEINMFDQELNDNSTDTSSDTHQYKQMADVKKSILVVDDKHCVRHVVADCLGERGY